MDETTELCAICELKEETPCLVTYEELPEIEKAYDRNTAFNTLKYIVSLGFQFSK